MAELLPLAIGRDIDLGAGDLQPLVVSTVEGDLHLLLIKVLDFALSHCRSDDQVDISVLPDGEFAVVEVISDGPSIAETDLARILQGFPDGDAYQDAVGGLGLSVAKAVAANLGGQITLADRTDGST